MKPILFWLSLNSFLIAAPSAQQIFQRLNGVPLLTKDPRYSQMTSLVNEGKLLEAAHLASEDNHFYSSTVRRFAAVMSNEKGSALVGLSDFEALVIGVVRDDVDARELLFGNFRYEGNSSLQLPVVSLANNNHFAMIESRELDLKTSLVKRSPQWDTLEDSAGLLTTRRWASEHYIAGTNRRATKFAISQFLCTPIEQWKTMGLSDHRVRQDVPRAPSGNPETYLNDCRSCHAPMDAMSGAFASVDFRADIFIWGSNWIAPKMTQNSNQYPKGYETRDRSWENLLSLDSHQERFGWRGPMSGFGLNAFGRMLAHSHAFSSCMVKHVFSRICRADWPEFKTLELSQLSDALEADQYHLRRLFENVAILPFCLSEEG